MNSKLFWENNQATYKGEIISKELLKYSKKYIGKYCLDVGAGDGSLMCNLVKMYKNKFILGIDICPKNELIRKGSCERIEFGSEIFDTVFLTDVIEHLEMPILKKCLKEVNRVLKDNGFVIIILDYSEDLKQEEVTCTKCRNKFHRWGHIHSFNEESIKPLLKDFEIVEMKRVDFGRRSKYWFYRFLDWKINKGDFYIVLKKK